MLAGHIFFGVAATLLLDWSWIPLSPQQKDSGRSLKDIKRSWGWDDQSNHTDENLKPDTKNR